MLTPTEKNVPTQLENYYVHTFTEGLLFEISLCGYLGQLRMLYHAHLS